MSTTRPFSTDYGLMSVQACLHARHGVFFVRYSAARWMRTPRLLPAVAGGGSTVLARTLNIQWISRSAFSSESSWA